MRIFEFVFCGCKLFEIFHTIVVSVMDPKLLMKILQVTFTGGPEGRKRKHIIVLPM